MHITSGSLCFFSIAHEGYLLAVGLEALITPSHPLQVLRRVEMT